MFTADVIYSTEYIGAISLTDIQAHRHNATLTTVQQRANVLDLRITEQLPSLQQALKGL